MTTAISRQYRSFEHTYLFRHQGDVITLKIYDIARQRILRKSFASNPAEVKRLFTGTSTDSLRSHFEGLLSLFEERPPDLSLQLDDLIRTLKAKIPCEGEEAESLTCPITHELFEEPVIDNCGHTFTKTAIETHLVKNNTCPLSRQLVTQLIPNRDIQGLVDALQAKDPIPTFRSFKQNNPTLAIMFLSVAKICIEQGEYEEALDAYEKAFQFTQDWKDYCDLPELFEKMDNPAKKQLAELFLAKYQFCSNHAPNSAIDLAEEIAQSYATSQPQKAISLYKGILQYNPCAWRSYECLANLLAEPEEKSHILLKASCQALEVRYNWLAEITYNRAETACSKFFIDKLIRLELSGFDPLATRIYLKRIAENYQVADNEKQAKKAYRYFFLICTKEEPSDPRSDYYGRSLDFSKFSKRLWRV